MLHVIAGVPAGSGMAESVPTLCRYLCLQGLDVTLVTTLNDPENEAVMFAQAVGVKIIRFPLSWPRAAYFSWQMLQGLRAFCVAADVVHVHGAWTFPVWWGGMCARWGGRPLVRSTRGSFQANALKHSALRKKIFGYWERYSLKCSSRIHVTSTDEQHNVFNYIYKNSEWMQEKAKITIIPNGVETVALKHSGIENNKKAVKPTESIRHVLYLGRMHPLKGLDWLVDAWTHVVPDHPRWHLLLVGADEMGMHAKLAKKIEQLWSRLEKDMCIQTIIDTQVCKKIEQKEVTRESKLSRCGIFFSKPIFGREKVQLLHDVDIVVLPSRSENFGIVVAEALAAGVPVIATKGTPWEELVAERCGWWVDEGIKPLVDALCEAMNLADEERHEMGENGRRLMGRKYNWETVSNQMIELYETVLRHG